MSVYGESVRYGTIRVLVVEDEGHVRRIICRLLRQIGFQLVDEAADGQEGLTEVVRTKPDIVLCDIHMPSLSGIDFLKKLRGLNNPTYSNMPVVFLTADANKDTVMVARELNVSGYLVKPVSLEQLKVRIDAALGI